VTDYLFRIRNPSGNVNEFHFSRGHVSQWSAKFASRLDEKLTIQENVLKTPGPTVVTKRPPPFLTPPPRLHKHSWSPLGNLSEINMDFDTFSTRFECPNRSQNGVKILKKVVKHGIWISEAVFLDLLIKSESSNHWFWWQYHGFWRFFIFPPIPF